MPINPELLAQGQHTQGGNIGANIVGGTRAKLNQTRNALLDVQLNEYQSPDQAGARRDAAELQSIISGVTVAYPLLAGGNVEGALGSLRARSQALRESGRNPQHTDELIANIEEGKVEETLQVMGQYLGVGQAEGFTLAPGAARFDAAGNPIVSNPKAPPQDPERVRLARAAGLQDGTPEFNDYVLNRGGADGQDGKAVEIQRLMAQYPDLSEPEATALAYEKLRLKTDNLGVTTLQNDIDGTIRVVEPKQRDLTSVQAPAEQTLFKAAEEGTGFWNAASRKIANVGGQFGLDPSFAEEEIKAKQLLDSSLRNLKQGYALSSKYPVAEQQMIVDEAGLLPSLWEDPQNMQARMVTLEGVLARSIAQAEIDAINSTDPQVKRDASRVARHMRSYMNAMGLPANKREDVRSWAQAQEGFFDMSKADQEEFIASSAALALLGNR